MNILQVIPNLRVAGAETMCENLSVELKNKGNNVTVVSLYSEETIISKRLKENSINVIFLDKKPGFDISIIRKIRRIIYQYEIEVVHAHLYASLYAMIAAIKSKVFKRFVTIHTIASNDNSKIGRLVNRFLFQKCNVTPIALTETIRDSIVKEYNVLPNKIPIIYNGIPINKYSPKKDYSLLDRFVICHVGRFSKVKNHELMIYTINEIKNKIPNIKLSFVGSGEQLELMKEKASGLGVLDIVSFEGLQADVKKYLEIADIFILPSEYEGMPMTLIEAMASGLPIIASNVGGIPDIVRPGIDGILIAPNIKELSDAIIELYSSKTLRESLGTSARKRSAYFSSEKMADDYLKVYNN